MALSLMFCSSMLAQQAPDNVAGDWTIYSTNIENSETVVKHVQITQSGNQLSGFFEGPNQSGPIQGEIHGNYIRFSTVTKNVLNFGGHVYGDRMSGSYGFRGKHAAWQAERTTPVGETASPVTGTVYAYQPVLAPPAPHACTRSRHSICCTADDGFRHAGQFRTNTGAAVGGSA